MRCLVSTDRTTAEHTEQSMTSWQWRWNIHLANTQAVQDKSQTKPKKNLKEYSIQKQKPFAHDHAASNLYDSSISCNMKAKLALAHICIIRQGISEKIGLEVRLIIFEVISMIDHLCLSIASLRMYAHLLYYIVKWTRESQMKKKIWQDTYAREKDKIRMCVVVGSLPKNLLSRSACRH